MHRHTQRHAIILLLRKVVKVINVEMIKTRSLESFKDVCLERKHAQLLSWALCFHNSYYIYHFFLKG